MDDALFLDICRDSYSAIIGMLREAIEGCSAELWAERSDEPPFWQQAYHTLWYLDFYLSNAPRSFQGPTLAQERAQNLDVQSGTVIPSREQILQYLEQVNAKCGRVLAETASQPLDGENVFHWTGPTYAHRLIYNMRHAQDHVSALRSMLTRKKGKSPPWRI